MNTYETYITNLNVMIDEIDEQIRSFNYHITNAVDESVRCCMRRERDRLALTHTELVFKKIQIDRAMTTWQRVGNVNLGDTLVV